MKFGMSMLLWTPFVTHEHAPLFRRLKELGFDGVEVPVNEGPDSHYQELGQMLADIGLEAVGVAFVTDEENPASPDAAIRAAALERFRLLTSRARALGASLICGPIHSAYASFTGKGPSDEELGWSAEVLHKAATQGDGMQLGVEYLNRFECYLVTSAAECDALVRRADHPSICSVYDTHHAHFEEQDIKSAIASCKDTMGHVQLSENNRGVPGRGQVDWTTTFAELRRINYDGWAVIESFSRTDLEFASALHIWRDFCADPDEVCAEGIAFLRRAWAEAQT